MHVVCAQCAISARQSRALRAAGPPVVLRRAARAQHGFVAQWARVDFALASVTCEDCVHISFSFQPPTCSKSSQVVKITPKSWRRQMVEWDWVKEDSYLRQKPRQQSSKLWLPRETTKWQKLLFQISTRLLGKEAMTEYPTKVRLNQKW